MQDRAQTRYPHGSEGMPARAIAARLHPSPAARTGLVAQRILREEGADLESVVIGHSGDTADLDYLRHLADNGTYPH